MNATHHLLRQLPSAATVAMSGLEAGDTLDVFFPFLLSTTVPLQVALPNGSLDVMEVDPTATVAEVRTGAKGGRVWR